MGRQGRVLHSPIAPGHNRGLLVSGEYHPLGKDRCTTGDAWNPGIVSKWIRTGVLLGTPGIQLCCYTDKDRHTTRGVWNPVSNTVDKDRHTTGGAWNPRIVPNQINNTN